MLLSTNMIFRILAEELKNTKCSENELLTNNYYKCLPLGMKLCKGSGHLAGVVDMVWSCLIKKIFSVYFIKF